MPVLILFNFNYCQSSCVSSDLHSLDLVNKGPIKWFLWCRAVVIYHGYLDEISGLHQHDMTLEKGKTAKHVLKCHYSTDINSNNNIICQQLRWVHMDSSKNGYKLWRHVAFFKRSYRPSGYFIERMTTLEFIYCLMHLVVYCCKCYLCSFMELQMAFFPNLTVTSY